MIVWNKKKLSVKGFNHNTTYLLPQVVCVLYLKIDFSNINITIYCIVILKLQLKILGMQRY